MKNELYDSIGQDDITEALHLLKQYVDLRMQVEDYKRYEEEIKQTIYEAEMTKRLEADELYANRTANAVIVAMNQKRAAEECEVIMKAIERAVEMIVEEEARMAITYRYLKGMSYKNTLLTMRRGVKSTTMDRRMKAGVAAVANTLRSWGILK